MGAGAIAVGSVLNSSAEAMKPATETKKSSAEAVKPAKAAMAGGFYVCSACGHVEFGAAPDNCPVCHSPKEKFSENNTIFSDAAAKWASSADKHTPAVVLTKKSMLVTEEPSTDVQAKIGKMVHPMDENHAIKWIDCYVDDKHMARVSLTIKSEPAATFYTKVAGAKIRIVSWCNLHGYWTTEAMA
jgi:desulfoferrodoxin-like iron-binding protein